jgi:hypothetical protein
MNATQKPSISPEMHTVQVLAQLMERLEHSKVAVDAGQYQAVVRRLSEALNRAEPGPVLNAVLDTHPATAELYENLQYANAGLCRAPLDTSLATERSAKTAIERAMHHSLQG